jgi:hypothetical protein
MASNSPLDSAIIFYIFFICIYSLVIVSYSPIYAAASANTAATHNFSGYNSITGTWAGGTTPTVQTNPFDFFASLIAFTTDYWMVNAILFAPLPLILTWVALKYVRGV